MTTSKCLARASASPAVATATGSPAGPESGSRWWGPGMRREHRHPGPLADDLQLVHRGGPLQVAGHQQRRVSLAAKPGGQFAGERRFTGALQAGEHDDGRRRFGERQPAGFAAQDADEFFVDDLDDLLCRVEGTGHLGAPGAVLDPTDERSHHGQRDVGLEQRQPDFAGGGLDVGVGQSTLAAQSLKGTGQSVRQRFKHPASLVVSASEEGASGRFGCRGCATREPRIRHARAGSPWFIFRRSEGSKRGSGSCSR